MSQHLERGKLLLQQNRNSDAEREFMRHLAIEPNDDEAHLYLSLCYLHTNKLEQALASVQQSIGLFPHNGFAFYVYSRILFALDRIKEARTRIDEAINVQPHNADFFAWSAQLFLFEKEYTRALEHANMGLTMEPDNVNCLNQRTTALVKLDKKEEAFDTIREALTEDPENSLTHANTGWALLEHNEHKKALQHFTESLRLNPNNEWAKHGMIEALKARYLVYRLFLKYMFWIGNLKGNVQWMVIIGLYLLQSVVRKIADSYPQYEKLLMPFIIAYIIFALSTWVLQPLFNVLLLMHPQGRYALSREEKRTSVFVAIALCFGLMAFIISLLLPNDGWMVLAVFGLSMMIPVSGLQRHMNPRQQKMLYAYALVLGVLGVLTCAMAFAGLDFTITGTIYVVLLLLYQFFANSLAIRR